MEHQRSDHDGSLVGGLLEGRYRVGPVLARGGMSTVYRGTDTRLDRPVAIKVMAPRFAADPVFLQRFEREARAAARLHHPGVVAVHDQGVDSSLAGNHAFLVMELVEGGTLRDLLRQHGRLSVPLAIAVADMVLSALAAAHQEGLVHRDIKPENVLIGSGGVVKVADFGLVRAAAEVSTTGDIILGTVSYLSPEQVTTGAADARSDVYAAGVLLFEMLTGAPPYTGDTALSVAYRHVNDDIPAPSTAGVDVPASLDDLVVRATRRDPAARPPDASEFLRELRTVRTNLRIDRVPVPVLAGALTTVAALPTDDGPGGTRALARVDVVTGEPDLRHRDPTGPSRGHQSWKQFPDQDPYLRERARNRRAFIIWLVIVLMLASAIGVGAWWLGSGRWTLVPNLTGLQRSAVETTLAAVDLKPRLIEDHHDAIPPGAVVSSDPEPGYRAARGSDVTVVISLGHPVVPELAVGITADNAEDALREADLSPRRDPAAEEFHSTVPRGTVIGVRPAAGTILTVGAPVTLVVSKGVAPTTVPDVRGLRQADAVSVLARAGLTAQLRRQFDGQVPGGRAIGTDPKAGTGTTRGTSVILLVSTASVVPEVVGLSVAQAQQVLADAGLNSTVTESFSGLPLFGGRVISQSPGAGQPVRPGTTIELTTL